MRRATGGEAVKSDEEQKLCFLRNELKYKRGKTLGETDADKKLISWVNKQMAPANVSTPIASSSESEAGPAGSQ
jgi:hypothetical protein